MVRLGACTFELAVVHSELKYLTDIIEDNHIIFSILGHGLMPKIYLPIHHYEDAGILGMPKQWEHSDRLLRQGREYVIVGVGARWNAK